jgi:hypothetical protein
MGILSGHLRANYGRHRIEVEARAVNAKGTMAWVLTIDNHRVDKKQNLAWWGKYVLRGAIHTRRGDPIPVVVVIRQTLLFGIRYQLKVADEVLPLEWRH